MKRRRRGNRKEGEGETNMNKAQGHGVWRILKHIGRIQELMARQNVQRRLGRSLGPGFEYNLKDLGVSELPKDFRTGNDMIRCEI